MTRNARTVPEYSGIIISILEYQVLIWKKSKTNLILIVKRTLCLVFSIKNEYIQSINTILLSEYIHTHPNKRSKLQFPHIKLCYCLLQWCIFSCSACFPVNLNTTLFLYQGKTFLFRIQIFNKNSIFEFEF